MPNYDLEMAESVIAARDLKIDELTVALEQAQADLAVVTDLKGTISAQLDCIEQYRSALAERDKVARDRLKRIEHLERIMKRSN